MTGPPELHGRLPVSDAWSMWHVAEVSNSMLVLAALWFAIDLITSRSVTVLLMEVHMCSNDPQSCGTSV